MTQRFSFCVLLLLSVRCVPLAKPGGASLPPAPARVKVMIVLPLEVEPGPTDPVIATLQGMLRSEAPAAFEPEGWTVLRARETEQLLRETPACSQRDCLVATAQALKVDAILGGTLHLRPGGAVDVSLLAFDAAGQPLEAAGVMEALRTKFQQRATGFLDLISKLRLSDGGGLTADEVGGIIRRHWNEIKYCYDKELTHHAFLAGRVTLFFQIGPAGTVVLAAAPEDELHNANVTECMLKNARGWKFPNPRGGGVVDVRYPFEFRSGK